MRTTLTIAQIVNEWLANTDIRQVSKDSYRRKLDLYFRWIAKNKKKIENADRSDVLQYKAEISERLRENTVDAYIKAIKSFYGYCEEKKYCHNIAAGIKSSRRVYYHAKDPLTEDQASSLLESISTGDEKGLRDKLIVSLMLFYGLRSCEVERLTVVDVSEDRIIRIQRKGRRDKSEIRISQDVYDLMGDYLSCRNVDLNDYVFKPLSTRKGIMLRRQDISKIVKGRMRAIGINSPKLTSHSLRHTCASLMILNDVSLEVVRDVLGHTSTNTTRIYTNTARRAQLLDNSPSFMLEKRIAKKRKI